MLPSLRKPQLPLVFRAASKSTRAVFLAAITLIALPRANGQISNFPSTASPQCPVKVVANEEIVSNTERVDTGYRVLPAGIIPDPGEWPYFAWSDTPLGVASSLDGSGYLFFGSDGGCHKNCTGTNQRWGSITTSHGTLDHPLGQPLGDPDPAPSEFLLPTSPNLPPVVDYVGGGPVYRVPAGEPGAGTLLLVYHVERPASPFWSVAGLAKSDDEGLSWQDLGLILSDPQPYLEQGAADIGDPSLVPAIDPATSEKYFYIFFPQHCWVNQTDECDDFTYLSAARAPYENLLSTAVAGGFVSQLFLKYYQGQWSQPGLEGKADELFPGVTDKTDGDPVVAWSSYRQRFVVMMDNGQDIAYGESIDGLHWPPMQVVLETSAITTIGYANAVGLGVDPGVLGEKFYSYYTAFPVPDNPWQPATTNRLTIDTACGAPSS